MDSDTNSKSWVYCAVPLIFRAASPSIFGTTRLAPFGSVQGTICWTGETVPSTDYLVIETQDNFGDTFTSSINVSLRRTARFCCATFNVAGDGDHKASLRPRFPAASHPFCGPLG